MPFIVVIAVLAATLLGRPSVDSCRSGPISVSFETTIAGHCVEYCGVRIKLSAESQTELAFDQCKTMDEFRVDGRGPYPVPAERDSFGTAHVRLR